MRYAIVYSSQTGNTKLLADTIQETLAGEECIYFGGPSQKALGADCIYVGFWTNKGRCNEEAEEFLKLLVGQKVFLFGTAGFGGDGSYFEKILDQARRELPTTATCIGTFMCQGKMPPSVRERYEDMERAGVQLPQLPQMIENFDLALSHPDRDDLQKLQERVLAEK